MRVGPCPWITGPEDIARVLLFSISPTDLGHLLPRAKPCRCPLWDPVSHLVVSLSSPRPISPPCEINMLAIPQCSPQPHLPLVFVLFAFVVVALQLGIKYN